MAEKRKKYDCIFKIDAVKLSFERSSLKEFSDELGISPCLLTSWRKTYQRFDAGSFLGSGYARIHPEDIFTYGLEKKAKESALRYEILKNASPHLCSGKLALYQFIKSNEKKYSIAKMCKVLNVCNGTYIRWKYKGIPKKQQQIALLKENIAAIFLRYKKYCGRAKIIKELSAQGYTISPRMVNTYMKQLGLRKIAKRKFKVTTDSKHTHYTSPNVLNRAFTVNSPSKIWVSDITYIQTKKGFLYLTIIMDLYDRKIIGWSLGTRLSTLKTTLAAWEMAIGNRTVSKGLIFHSDRGVQYANKAFTSKLNSYECIRSMSRKGNSIDNAVCESFFNSLKRELIYRKSELINQKIMRGEIFEFIENWYNKKRMHSALNYKTIEQFNANRDMK